jgi:hypothetical protein
MAVQGLGVIKDIAGEGTAIGKAAAIAQATISGVHTSTTNDVRSF